MFPRPGLGLGHVLQTEADQKSLGCRVAASEAPEEIGRVLRAAGLEPDLLELPRHLGDGRGVLEASLGVGGENISGYHS